MTTHRRLQTFARKYGEDTLALAYHAALPVALTPELLHLIRLNFLPELDYLAEANLLLHLCQEIGEGLYEIESTLRTELLQTFAESPDGASNLRAVAALLWRYSEQAHAWANYERLARAQQLTVLSMFEPHEALNWLAQAETLPSASDQRAWFIAMREELRIIPHKPKPEADIDFINDLSQPGGALGEEPFYISRPADYKLQRALLKPRGSTISILAPRQMGKTSMLMRGLKEARLAEYQTVHIDFQRFGRDLLDNPDGFLRHFATMMVRQLGLDRQQVNMAWEDPISPYDKLNYLLEDYILPTIKSSMVLAMDEMDGLLQTDFHNDFFSMVRFWFNNRIFNPIWDKLNVFMVIPTEPHLLITDTHRSPFNVGELLRLADFDAAQVSQLNERYQSPLPSRHLPEFMAFFGGQPYLTQQAFYTMVTQNLTWDELLAVATRDDGPFDGHLHRFLRLLTDDKELHQAMRQILAKGSCSQPLFYRLLQVGLIQGEAQRATCRCGLYDKYFRARL